MNTKLWKHFVLSAGANMSCSTPGQFFLRMARPPRRARAPIAGAKSVQDGLHARTRGHDPARAQAAPTKSACAAKSIGKKKAASEAKKAAGKKALATTSSHHGHAPLVIVESPTKAKTIGKFLGGKYRVKASVGHIRDLPKSRLGVDLENDFAPTYIVPMAKKPRSKS